MTATSIAIRGDARRLLVTGVATLAAAELLLLLTSEVLAEFATPRPCLAVGCDAEVYWSAWQGGLYHGQRLLWTSNSYIYGPPFAQLLWPLTLLPYAAFRLVLAGMAVATYTWLLRPASWPWRIVLGLVAAYAVAVGNIEWALCLVMVFAARAPWAWALPLLTKVTPGVGACYYLGAREWRKFAIAAGATLAVVAVSFVLAPDTWPRWFDTLALNAAQPEKTQPHLVLIPLWLRGIAALVVALVAGRYRWRPGLVVVLLLAQPDSTTSMLALLCALPRLSDELHDELGGRVEVAGARVLRRGQVQHRP